MKKQEFIEKLKSIAKENGFEIRNESAEDYELFSVGEREDFKISTPSVIFLENNSSYSGYPVFTFHVRNFKIDYTNGPEIGRHLANEFQNFIINKQNNEKQQ